MRYKVKYINDKGIKEEKIYTSNSQIELIENLKSRNLKVLNISELKKKANERNLFSKNIIKEKLITEFLRQLSILLKSGIDIKSAIEILHKQEKDIKLKESLLYIANNLDSGFTLGKSFELTNRFPNLIISVVEAGESSSKLPESLEILAEYYDNERKNRDNIRNAMYYPLILLFVTGIIVIGIVTFVLPKYASLFESYENLDLPLVTRILIDSVKFFKQYFFILPIIILITLILLEFIRKNEKLNIYMSKKVLNLPIVGNYIVNLETQRFSGIFSLLIKSGVDLIETIEIASNTFSNKYLKTRVSKSKEDILKGMHLSDALENIEELPYIFLSLIKVGESTSKLEESMDISHNYYKDLVSNQRKKLTALFEPLIIIFVSIIVGIIVIALALPTFSVVNIL